MLQQAGTELGRGGAIPRARRDHRTPEETIETRVVARQKIRQGSRHQGCLLNVSPSPL